MMTAVMPDPSTAFGERVARRLRDEPIIWLTTTGADGTPHPNPVWFLWDGESFLIYSLPDAARLVHIQKTPRVALNLDGNGKGGDIIIIAGHARINPHEAPADQVPAYVEKYKDFIAHSFGAPANFAARYSTPIRVTPTKVRGG